MVMVSRNLERANENDGFKMTALEYHMIILGDICDLGEEDKLGNFSLYNPCAVSLSLTMLTTSSTLSVMKTMENDVMGWL